MRTSVIVIFLAPCLAWQLVAQERTIHELDEVIVSDSRLKQYSEGYRVTELNDSTLSRNGSFLTSLLSFNSNIYFKENGFGMVSSPAFRGTNASHTAVVWNGININSQMNGQVDFNTINPLNYSSVGVRSGGGSVQFGTGAIGGSVHLVNDLRFAEHFEHRAFFGYGSFDTKNFNYGQSYGTGKWSSNFGINYTSSDNDYKYLRTDDRNTNGEFENVNLNFNSGYRISDRHMLRLYHQSFIGRRNLSGNLVAPGRSRYEDDHHRTQIEWGRFGKKARSKLKLAHLYEAFKYFENKDSDLFSDGRVTTLLARYSLEIPVSRTLRVSSFAEYDHYDARGDSFGNPSRNDLSVTAVLKHSISKKTVYNLGIRQDFSSDFSSPLVFSIDGRRDFGEHYRLQLNASRNFRMPTFNDLYWRPGGNLDLVPERSYQVDLGHRLTFENISFELNGFYMDTEDMIRWLPNNDGLWSPINVDQVHIYGVEAGLEVTYALGKRQKIDFTSHYAYTVSEDRRTKRQLIYVPFHRGNASLAYNLSDLSLFYQQLYNGPVSIIGGQLKGYHVANAGMDYKLPAKGKFRYGLGCTVNNLFNTYYENVALRPMPNRNIQFRLALNF